MAPYDFAAARRHVEDMLGYEFTNLDYLQEALHAGDPIEIGEKLIDGKNKKLAVLGDAALDLALAIASYQGGGSRKEMDDRRSSAARNNNLSRLGEAKRIDTCIRLSWDDTFVGQSTRATTMEALLGAVYLDSGDLEEVRRGIAKLGL